MLDDENPHTAKGAIAVMINMRQLEVAKQAIELVMEIYENDADLFYYLAVVEYHSGNVEVALQHLEHAIEIPPSLTLAQDFLQQITS